MRAGRSFDRADEPGRNLSRGPTGGGFAVIIALLAGGNFFCMVCSFHVASRPGDAVCFRHGTAGREPCASKWLAAGPPRGFYLWTYEAFGLWASPWWTAWIVVGYFVTAFLVDGLFEGASFCKYVCPIGQFHFVNSLMSPLEVKVKSPQACESLRDA